MPAICGEADAVIDDLANDVERLQAVGSRGGCIVCQPRCVLQNVETSHHVRKQLNLLRPRCRVATAVLKVAPDGLDGDLNLGGDFDQVVPEKAKLPNELTAVFTFKRVASACSRHFTFLCALAGRGAFSLLILELQVRGWTQMYLPSWLTGWNLVHRSLCSATNRTLTK